MNIRVLRALAWEHGRRSLPFLGFGLFIGVVCGLSTQQFSHRYLTDAELAWVLHTVTISVAALGMLYTLSVDDRLVCGIPPNTLLLPVAARDIVMVRFVVGMASIAALSAVFTFLQSFYVNEQAPWWKYAILAAGVFAALQLFAILATPLGDWSLAILGGLLISTFFAFGGLAIVFESDATIPVMVRTMVVCPFIAWAVVYLQRHGQWGWIPLPRLPQRTVPKQESSPERAVFRLSLITWFVVTLGGLYAAAAIRDALVEDGPMLNISLRQFLAFSLFPALVVCIVASIRSFRAMLSSTKPFRSAAHAQHWFELIRVWPLFVGFFVIASLLQSFWWADYYSDPLDILFFTLLCAAPLTGLVMLFLNFRLQHGSMRAFLYLRPMHSRNLAAARAFAYVHILLLPAAILFFFSDIVQMSHHSSSWDEALLMMLAMPWLALWIGNGIVAFSGGAVLSAVLPTFFPEGDQEAHLIFAFAPVLTVAALGLFVVAQRRGLIYSRLLVIAPVMLAALWSWREQQQHSLDQSLVPVLAAMIAVLPLLTVPLVTHWARHR